MMTPTYSPLLTDLYQLTMAYGYWRLKKHDQEAVFQLIYRSNPFNGNYSLCCGLGSVIDFLHHWRFEADDLNYLASLTTAQGGALFPTEFLQYLSELKFTCHIDAIPEGTIVFPNLPLVRVEGPILQCQLLETALLNMINFQTLIATKATRVCRAAQGDPVIDFGMRRAQGPDGALSASRAAYIGGCIGTSNTLAGKVYGIPVRGTHAHSWVSAFTSELDAFNAYADVLPHNCVFLVDTYNTIEGIENAITVGNQLKAKGAPLLGIRLDSGDMAALSIAAREMLDAAGFTNTDIMASNTLDEYRIQDLKQRGAKISVWGVGTHLVTAYDQPALDGVYKLSSLRGQDGCWDYKLKISEEAIKTSNPGRHQVRRFFCDTQYIMDVIYDLDLGIEDIPLAVTLETGHLRHLDDIDGYVDLLQPIMRHGILVQAPDSIQAIRQRACQATEHFYHTHQENVYPVGIEKKLFELKKKLLLEIK